MRVLTRSRIDRPLLDFVPYIRAKSRGEVPPFCESANRPIVTASEHGRAQRGAVTRAFRKLRKPGAVEIKDRQIYVTDADALNHLAEIGR